MFVILMENQNWSTIRASRAAPYINRTLLPQASFATRYFNPPGIHPSLPNYLWLEAGNAYGIADDDDPSHHYLRTRLHLTTLLAEKGISWKAYQEDIPSGRCPLNWVSGYAPKHDPFVYFDDVTDGLSPQSATCIAHVRPYAELASDLKSGNVARYNFITPNLCNDMHDCGIGAGDRWLSRNLPAILGSAAFQNGGALFITWDEATAGDGPIGLIAVSPFAKGHGYSNAIPYTHGSLLRTVEEIFAVTPLLGDAAKQQDLSDLFTAFP